MYKTWYNHNVRLKMQSFAKRIRACRGYSFFGSPKEVGVGGKAPDIKTKYNFNFDKI